MIVDFQFQIQRVENLEVITHILKKNEKAEKQLLFLDPAEN